MEKVENYMELYGGRAFYFSKLSEDDIDINIIAHSLSLQCRYLGHCKYYYSVAEHCALMSDYVYDTTGDKNLALEALLHDATEAYVGDIPRPFKALLPEHTNIENQVKAYISEKFGVPFLMSPIIKYCDYRILKDEREQVMIKSDNKWVTDDLEPLGVTIKFRPPNVAEHLFLARFYEYSNG